MWLILLCSVVSIAVFAERLLYFHRATINLGEFLQGLSNLVRKGNLAEARVECQATSVPATRVIHAALIRHHLPRTELREIIQEAGQMEVPRLERNLGMLIAIGYICPLIGLLGTVTGLIQAFRPIIRKQRVRHPRRRFRRDLPESADHRCRSGGDDSHHPRLLPSFCAFECSPS